MRVIRDQKGQSARALTEERELRLLMLLPFGMLVIATALAVGVNTDSTTESLEELGLAALTAGWMGLIYLLRPHWPQRQRLMVGCYAVLLALMAGLVLRNPLYGFYTWTGYIWGSVLFSGGARSRLAAYVPVAVITATSQHGGLPRHSASSWISWIAFVAINLLAAAAVSWFATTREQEQTRRKQMIDELTDANARLEASLRENAGLHAQLVAQAREAGMLDERQRMAGEIHDTLAQGLVGIITQLEAASQAPPFEEEGRRHTQAAIELARESLAEARRSVQALAPTQLEHARLPDALREVTGKWSERSQVNATVSTTGDPCPLRQEIELALLRTAQEALANVAKHANASRVVVTLSYMGEIVALDVHDDGLGFLADAKDLNNGGFGLRAMRQRVERLAGTLEVESDAVAGTTIAARIPMIPAGSPV